MPSFSLRAIQHELHYLEAGARLLGMTDLGPIADGVEVVIQIRDGGRKPLDTAARTCPKGWMRSARVHEQLKTTFNAVDTCFEIPPREPTAPSICTSYGILDWRNQCRCTDYGVHGTKVCYTWT